MASKVSFGNGVIPKPERWPFATLKPGQFFQCDDIAKHTAIRSAANRAKKRLGKPFSVHMVKLKEGTELRRVIRVYLNK